MGPPEAAGAAEGWESRGGREAGAADGEDAWVCGQEGVEAGKRVVGVGC